MHILRSNYLESISAKFEINPICALLGPRQCGKTTLALDYAKTLTIPVNRFDLEDPDHWQALTRAKLTLAHLEGLIIIDEIQRLPDLFTYLRVLVDKKPNLKILILGSASQDLIRQSSESLAGRISYIHVMPFNLQEIKDYPDLHQSLWLRGGFPKSILAKSNDISFGWRKDYIKTFLERDIPSFGFSINPQIIRRFWNMLADCHGQIFNASELGRSLELDSKTTRRYLDILTGTFMTRTLMPWFANISKRQVKSPKIYFRDSGIQHYFLNIQTYETLIISSKIGASWEGYAMEEIIRHHKAEDQDCYFWCAQSSAEVDLLIHENNTLQAFEFKYSSAPKLTKSMVAALELLKLDKLTIIIPGVEKYYIHPQIEVLGLSFYLFRN